MADADEDRIHLDAADGEQDDETPDFRGFSALLRSKSSSLPRRGEKDFEQHGTLAQADTLAHSRYEMHLALSYMRIHKPDRRIRGVYIRETGLTRVENPKSKLFTTIGRTDRFGITWLLPEEALYLLERGDLEVRWEATNHVQENEGSQETPKSSERSVAAGSDGTEGQDDSLLFSLQTAYAVYVGDDSNGLSLERFNVYANLKRTGFTVFRGPAWDPESHDKDKIANRAPSVTQNDLWTWLYNLIGREERPEEYGPLVGPGPYRSYPGVYKRLALVPRLDPTFPTLREDGQIGASEQMDTSIRVAWYVYKPREGFKKSDPGLPDFRIAVTDARETSLPSIEQLDGLFSSVPYSPPNLPPGNDSAGKLYTRLKWGYRNVVLAVVDQGLISYLRLSDAGFGHEKLFDGAGRTASGNKSGRGGRGRGRGGGRGGRR